MVHHVRAQQELLTFIANVWKIRSTIDFLPYPKATILQPEHLTGMQHYVTTACHDGESCFLICYRLHFCNKYIALIIMENLAMYQIQLSAPRDLFDKGSIFQAELVWSTQQNCHILYVRDVVYCSGAITHSLHFTERHDVMCKYFNDPPQRHHVHTLDAKKIKIQAQKWVPMSCFHSLTRQNQYDMTVSQYLFIPTNQELRFAIQKNAYCWSRRPIVCLFCSKDGTYYGLNHTFQCDDVTAMVSNVTWNLSTLPQVQQSCFMAVYVERTNDTVDVEFAKWTPDRKYPDHVNYIRRIIEATKMNLDSITIQPESSL